MLCLCSLTLATAARCRCLANSTRRSWRLQRSASRSPTRRYSRTRSRCRLTAWLSLRSLSRAAAQNVLASGGSILFVKRVEDGAIVGTCALMKIGAGLEACPACSGSSLFSTLRAVQIRYLAMVPECDENVLTQLLVTAALDVARSGQCLAAAPVVLVAHLAGFRCPAAPHRVLQRQNRGRAQEVVQASVQERWRGAWPRLCHQAGASGREVKGSFGQRRGRGKHGRAIPPKKRPATEGLLWLEGCCARRTGSLSGRSVARAQGC